MHIVLDVYGRKILKHLYFQERSLSPGSQNNCENMDIRNYTYHWERYRNTISTVLPSNFQFVICFNTISNICLLMYIITSRILLSREFWVLSALLHEQHNQLPLLEKSYRNIILSERRIQYKKFLPTKATFCKVTHASMELPRPPSTHTHCIHCIVITDAHYRYHNWVL